jgi:pimeloyl-ACP methyl ester carboxylesterase
MWEPQLAFAERGWHVIAPQFRGFDGVDANAAAESVDDYAGDVIDLLDALHIQDAVVVGLSLGGYVAFAMQRLAPRYIRGLVLADTRPQADTPDGVEGRKRMMQLALDGGAAAVAAEMIPKLLGETTRRERPAVVETVRTLVLSNSVGAMTGALRAMMTRPDSTPLLASIHVPTLIVAGDEDVVTPPSVANEMHRAIAGSELAIVPGSGHLSNLENTAGFNDVLARFLEHRV